jgi:O-methyltransferase
MSSVLKMVRGVLHAVGVDIVRHYPAHSRMPSDIDPWVVEIVRKVRSRTMTTNENIHALCSAVSYLSASGIAGDIVECGVWRGGSMMAAALALLRSGDVDRDLYLYDTYEGMSAPTDQDIDSQGRSALELFGADGRSGDNSESVWEPESVDGVRHAMASTGIDMARCHFIKGRVEDTLPGSAPERIALLRLDTDWYESTRHELRTLGPRIVDGGILIIDDYGYWKGARKATDEYLNTLDRRLYMHRIDSTARLVVVKR